MKSTSPLQASEVNLAPMLCKHGLTGDAPANKMCVNRYDCARCEYDQMLEDTAHLVLVQVKRVQRMAVAA